MPKNLKGAPLLGIVGDILETVLPLLDLMKQYYDGKLSAQDFSKKVIPVLKEFKKGTTATLIKAPEKLYR